MTAMHLLPHAERFARAREKRIALLRFLRQNIYTSADVAAELLQLSRSPANQTLAAMGRDGLIRRESIGSGLSRPIVLWGITAHGQGFAFNPASGEQPCDRIFEPGRVGLSVLQHTLDLQLLQVKAERAGWTDWQLGDRLQKWVAGQGRPDAIATTQEGVRVAIECERTMKTTKRYSVVLADRLQAIKRGEFQFCIWLCPDAEMAQRLEAIVKNISVVRVASLQQRVDPEKHHTKIKFLSYGQWPKEVLL